MAAVRCPGLAGRDWPSLLDDISMIFVRRRAAPAGWLSRKEFSCLRPGDLQVTALKTLSGMMPFEKVAAEVARYRREIGAQLRRAGSTPGSRTFGWRTGLGKRRSGELQIDPGLLKVRGEPQCVLETMDGFFGPAQGQPSHPEL